MLIQFNTGKTDIVLVKASEDYRDGFIALDSKGQCIQWPKEGLNAEYDGVSGEIELPTGNWKIVGNPFELSEEQCQEIMPVPAIRPKYGHPYGAVPALHSWTFLLRDLKVYQVNPFAGIFRPHLAGSADLKDVGSVLVDAIYNDLRDEWKKAEERTGNWILLTTVKA